MLMTKRLLVTVLAAATLMATGTLWAGGQDDGPNVHFPDLVRHGVVDGFGLAHRRTQQRNWRGPLIRAVVVVERQVDQPGDGRIAWD